MKALNIDAAKQLINKYRSITLAKIEEASNSKIAKKLNAVNTYGEIAMAILTGFGTDNCILCKKANAMQYTEIKRTKITVPKCQFCIYRETSDNHFVACTKGKNATSYSRIENARTAKELHKAIRLRANHIERLLKKIENGQFD